MYVIITRKSSILIQLLLTYLKLSINGSLVCWVIRHWILILCALCVPCLLHHPSLGPNPWCCLLHHPSVDPCMVCSNCSSISPGGSSVYQDWKKYFILSHSAQTMFKISNSLNITASSSVDPWCAPLAVSSIPESLVCASFALPSLVLVIHHSRPSAF